MLTVQNAAKELDVSPDTIRRWEKKGLIKSKRDKNNHRVFDIGELERVKNKSEASHKFEVLKSPPTQHNVIELFAGAGGLALGLKNAGLKTELLVEWDKNPANTLRENIKLGNMTDCEVIHGDVAGVDFTKYQGNVDIVTGGFPCQSFSYAGNSMGFEDTRGTLFFEFARCVKEVQPKIAIGENVRGLLNHDDGKTLNTMLNVLKGLGYKVSYKVLRCQFLDVPQKRERLIIVGIRDDIALEGVFFPKEKDYIVALRDALMDCPESIGQKYPPKKQKILSMVSPGGYWRDLPIDVQKEYMGGSFYLGGGKTGMARRLSWDEPSLTLTCSPAQKQTERCHPEETRPLTVREYARIQSFPDEWAFEGSMSSQYKQIGNAVPVNLGYHVGRCAIAMLENEFDSKTMTKEDFVEIEEEPQIAMNF